MLIALDIHILDKKVSSIRMVKWALLIFLLIILLYFSNLSLSSISEEFAEESLYERAVDRANPLAANESPTNPKIPIGISQTDGVSQRNMYQIALNIPTAMTGNGVSFSQVTPNNQVSPRIDNENSFMGLSKFCKDTAAGSNPFNNTKFNENCGICLSSGSLADGTPFIGETGLAVYAKDKEIFMNEKTQNTYPFTRAIPSLKDGSRVSCNDSSKGSDAKPVLAINKEDYEAFKKRSECINNNQIGNNCGVCLNSNNISWVDPNGDFKLTTLYLWGSGSATVTVGGAPKGASQVLDTTTAKSYDLADVKEGENIGITVSGSTASVYGIILSKTPSDGKYRLAIDKFLLIDGETGQFPKSGGKTTVTIEAVNVEVLILKAQKTKSQISLQGHFPLSFVDSEQLASYDCPNAPYVTSQDNNDIFGTGGSCILPKGQTAGNYTDECLKETISLAGCSTGGEWYSDLDILRTDMGNKSLPQITSAINAGSSTDIEFQRKCKAVDITTPCDDYLQGGIPNKACLTYLYNGGDARWTQRGFGAIYSGSSSGDKCTSAGTMNPDNSNSDLFSEAIKGIDAVKTLLTQTLQKARSNLNINVEDTNGGRNTSYNKCIGPSPIPPPPPPPPAPPAVVEASDCIFRFTGQRCDNGSSCLSGSRCDYESNTGGRRGLCVSCSYSCNGQCQYLNGVYGMLGSGIRPAGT